MKRKINLLILILFIISNNFNAQEFSIHSLKIGAGYGVSHGKKNSGFGIFHSFGYQKNIWKNRFRLNPNFSFGTYSTKLFTCVKDEYFNSINFEINLFFDFIKTENYSLFIGNGSFLNHSKGLIGKKGVLWWSIHKILQEKKVKPKYLFLENVDRLLKSPAKQRGRDFAIISSIGSCHGRVAAPPPKR